MHTTREIAHQSSTLPALQQATSPSHTEQIQSNSSTRRRRIGGILDKLPHFTNTPEHGTLHDSKQNKFKRLLVKATLLLTQAVAVI